MARFADHMILYIEKTLPKTCYNKYIYKIARYKINIQFLYSKSKLSVREIKKTIALISKTVKYLGINLNKKVRDIYTESHKTFIERKQRRPK